jgi:N-acetylglutamate synthase-like GNAT family acetyltransferase
VEYQVRDARITDIERITALMDASAMDGGAAAADEDARRAAADLLRQLVYLPQAVVLVADIQRRIVGAAVLALRPSVTEAGYVGTFDVVAVDPGYATTGVLDTLVEELARMARNKGCVVVEAPQPADAATMERWVSHGFAPGAARITRPLMSAGTRI